MQRCASSELCQASQICKSVQLSFEMNCCRSLYKAIGHSACKIVHDNLLLKMFLRVGKFFFCPNSIWRLFAYIVNPTSDWCQNVCCMSFFTGWISTVAQSSDVLVQVHCSLLFSFPLYFLNTDNKYFFIFRCFPFLLMNALKDRWQGWSPSNGISVFQFNIFLCIAK